MAPSQPRIDSITQGPAGLEIQFWADHARSTTLETSSVLPGGNWAGLLNATGLSRPQHVRFTNAPAGSAFYRVVIGR